MPGWLRQRFSLPPMGLLVFLPGLPLPFGGTDARWLYVVVTELARRGVDVMCISSTEESEDAIDRATRSATQLGFELIAVPLAVRDGMLRRKLASLRRPFSERDRDPALRRVLDR